MRTILRVLLLLLSFYASCGRPPDRAAREDPAPVVSQGSVGSSPHVRSCQ